MSHHALTRALAILGAVTAVTVPLGSGSDAVAASTGGTPDGGVVTVMTRNLDEGTDFGYVIAALQGQLPFTTAAAATYGEVLASDVCGRAAAVADEIAAAQPDLVSLQEVAEWTGPVATRCGGAVTTTIDARAALEDRLRERGAHYVEVHVLDEFDSSGIPGLPFSFLDRDILLARVEPAGQLTLSNPMWGHFATLLPLPIGPVLRGWISVDATHRGRTVRVIATHLEGFNDVVQEAQAMELAAGPANTSLPVVLAGDLNTGPGSAQADTYTWLTSPAGGGFTDTWAATRPRDPGYTDSFYLEDQLPPGTISDPTPTASATPSERIDLVLVRGGAHPSEESPDYQVGLEIPHPSDHAGVVAPIRLSSGAEDEQVLD